jgi:hypothetical protein
MTRVKTCNLKDDTDAFCQDVAAYRNSKDWAKLQRDELIWQANERAVSEAIHGGIDLAVLRANMMKT